MKSNEKEKMALVAFHYYMTRPFTPHYFIL